MTMCAAHGLVVGLFFLAGAYLVHAQWVTHGTNLLNRRWAEDANGLSPESAKDLRLSWTFPTMGDVTATPAVHHGVVFCPDWAGMLYAVEQRTGKLRWAKNFSADYGFPVGTYSRATPAVAGKAESLGLSEDLVVLGTAVPGAVVAVSRKTGELVWKTVVEDVVDSAKITGAVTIVGRGVYGGVASNEESSAADPSYTCCKFIGSVFKLDLQTGAVLWKSYTLPQGRGYAGGGVWAATPSVDEEQGLVYTGVGNLYNLPPEVQACQAQNANRSVVPDPCQVPGNKQDSVVALNMTTGEYQWTAVLNPIDAWTAACHFAGPGQPLPPNCPATPGPDYDFGMSPMLFTIKDPRPGKGEEKVDAAIIGQKSGVIYALDRSSGEVLWSTVAGPGGSLGGTSWGLASDGERVFAGFINSDNLPFYLPSSNTTVTTGAWIALDIHTGAPLWEFPNPSARPSFSMLPSGANGIVFAPSADPLGNLFALEAASGKVLWQFSAGTSMYGGVSIDKGCIYFGHGYGLFTPFLGTTGGGPQSIYSFCVESMEVLT